MLEPYDVLYVGWAMDKVEAQDNRRAVQLEEINKIFEKDRR